MPPHLALEAHLVTGLPRSTQTVQRDAGSCDWDGDMALVMGSVGFALLLSRSLPAAGGKESAPGT